MMNSLLKKSWFKTNRAHTYRIGTWTRYSLIMCLFNFIFWGIFYYPKWNNFGTESAISYDVSGYYLYLPAIFIYKDLKQVKFLEEIDKRYNPSTGGQVYKDPNSENRIMKYSCGQAIHMFPWFVMGHIGSKITNYPSDGFSFPYQFAIGFGMLLYCFLGVYLLARILSYYFEDHVVAMVLIAICFGSNYLEYGAISTGMTHNTLFTNYTILIWASYQFHQHKAWKYAIIIGVIVGLNALTRPTEIIAFLIPLLWGINASKKSIHNKIKLISTQKFKILTAIVLVAVIGSIQLCYWKYISGSWFVYSYEDQGFSWFNPHFKGALLSFRTGWLSYSPIFIPALIGFYFLRKSKDVFIPFFSFSILFIYLISAWDIYWYGGALGQRAMVQCYPILAFALAAFFTWALKNPILTYLSLVGISLCIAYNFWLTHIAHKGQLLKPGYMNRSYFLHNWMESDRDPDLEKTLNAPEYFIGRRKNVIPLSGNPIFQNDTIVIKSEQEFTDITMIEATRNNRDWLRVSMNIYTDKMQWEFWAMNQLIVAFYDQDHEVARRFIRMHNQLFTGEITPLYFDVHISAINFDRIKVFIWNPVKQNPMTIYDPKLELFND